MTLIIILLAVAAIVAFVIAKKDKKTQVNEIELAPESTPAPTVVAEIVAKHEEAKTKKPAAKKPAAKKPVKKTK
jgi:glucan phosphoethanolaminetransferase (alkaline phosphatase superfamily)